MNNIQLAHGSGGQAMQQLINSLFMEAFANPWLAEQEDQARLDLAQLVAEGDRLAFSTTVTSLTRCSFLAVISASWRFAAPRMTLRSVALFRAISPVALSSKKDCRWRH
ncbi:hydrogenase isoenzymes formation protein [Escherichia coli]|nr:hydrogenase isoenzymes formation protein [Escherichia coli]